MLGLCCNNNKNTRTFSILIRIVNTHLATTEMRVSFSRWVKLTRFLASISILSINTTGYKRISALNVKNVNHQSEQSDHYFGGVVKFTYN
jgi:hypothetical protein